SRTTGVRTRPTTGSPPMRYWMTHRSTYDSERPFDNSFQMLHLTPRALPHQRVLRSEIVVLPAAEAISERRDYFGNDVRYLAVAEPHERLTITMRARLEVS